MDPITIDQILTPLISFVIVFIIAFGIDLLLIKVNKKLLLILPIFFFIAAVILWILGFASDDWGRLGFMIYAAFSTIAFVASLVAFLILWFHHSKSKRINN